MGTCVVRVSSYSKVILCNTALYSFYDVEKTEESEKKSGCFMKQAAYEQKKK
jgi:homoserine trans-succinylase